MANKIGQNFFTADVQTMNRFILIDTTGNHFDSSFHSRIVGLIIYGLDHQIQGQPTLLELRKP